MKSKHFFVAALDVAELMPFTITNTDDYMKMTKIIEDSRKKLESFMNDLIKNFKEDIWYMGSDVIGEKNYERFIFDKGGFFEVMTEAPVALNAHFVHKKRAGKFREALIKTLKKILPDDPATSMFLDSIEVREEAEDNLKVEVWDDIKEIRE